MRYQLLLVLILMTVSAAGSFAAEPSLVAICAAGSVNGSRTELSEGSHTIMEDRTTLSRIVYSFDYPEKGMVRILYGKEEAIGIVLNEHRTYKTVGYKLGGVSFMDTVFFELGKVLSTEHKNLFGAAIATTWGIDCVIH